MLKLVYVFYFIFQFNDVITRNQAGCSFLHTSPDVVIQVATETKHTYKTRQTNKLNMQHQYARHLLHRLTSLCISAHEKL